MFTIIAAVDENYGIGYNGMIPWKNTKDLQHFKRFTMNQELLVGRVTFETLPKLKNRTLHVLSNGNMKDYLDKKYILIGGAKVWEYALENNYVERIVLTKITGKHNCDTFFPKKYLDSFYVYDSQILDPNTTIFYLVKNDKKILKT